ncbi:hypothetical protein K488DRAFT_88766 [Vararia minispora EC-137]|uniref:Uncharacterized protein n=1 Tax=Vararia minispora EC-137 TaxID=1314806 RepID=A0ACB8QCR0_9AGAM|nr:hypothetical protein K488DRAFT_88766 [Vararia minispora EC-137]
MVASVPPSIVVLDSRVFTTTVFEGPTAVPSTIPRNDAPIPVGIIVGGAVGGMALAFITVTLWTWWGRCIKRKQAKQLKEMRDLLAVRENTRRNAQTALVPRSGTHYTTPARSARRGSRKIKFAALPSDFIEKEPQRAPSPVPPTLLGRAAALPPLPGRPEAPALSFLNRTPWGTSVLPAGGPVIMPRPKITRPDPVAGGDAGESAENARLSRGSFDSRRLRHMPSAVSSESVYSTQSGEARIEGPHLREQRSGFFATLRQQLDVNRLSAFSIGSLYSAES